MCLNGLHGVVSTSFATPLPLTTGILQEVDGLWLLNKQCLSALTNIFF